ncbi:MAG: hypothetical protein ABWY82_04635 [Tardiphaga sp.]
MVAVLTPDEFSRARKIAAMLSSDQQGEQINALALLKKIADSKKIRVDELLGMLGSLASGPRSEPPRPGPDWRDMWRPRPGKTNASEGGDYTDSSYTDRSNPEADRAFAEALRRQHQARREREDKQRKASQQFAEELLRERQAKTSNNLKARLDVLQSIPESRLSAWEQDFRYSILDKALSPFWTPSEKQSAIINKILEKAL